MKQLLCDLRNVISIVTKKVNLLYLRGVAFKINFLPLHPCHNCYVVRKQTLAGFFVQVNINILEVYFKWVVNSYTLLTF